MLLFSHRVRHRAQEIGGWLCVGVDPQLEKLPADLSRDAAGVVQFCREIVTATEVYAACYKINFAFFEALGEEGWRSLAEVRRLIPPTIPVIADAKRGDIGSTSAAYARAIFEQLEFDAATVSPYLGWDALAPFMQYQGKALFVLCKTSNPGAGNLQDLLVDGEPLYLRLARQAIAQESQAEVGLVVGATYPDSLRAVRTLDQDMLLLVPGVGAQGARAGEALAAGANSSGENALISVSREILHASPGREFAAAAESAARRLVEEMRASS